MPRELLLGACASLGAVLIALAALKAADGLGDALGLGQLRPLTLVVALFLTLTVLQAAWDRIERLVRPSSRRGHVSKGSAE